MIASVRIRARFARGTCDKKSKPNRCGRGQTPPGTPWVPTAGPTAGQAGARPMGWGDGAPEYRPILRQVSIRIGTGVGLQAALEIGDAVELLHNVLPKLPRYLRI